MIVGKNKRFLIMPDAASTYGQDWLIERMQKLGYPSDPLGVCFGLSMMANQALLLGEIDHFYKRLLLIFTIPTVEICKYIEDARVQATDLIKKVKADASLRYNQLSPSDKRKINEKLESEVEIQQKIKTAIITILKENLREDERIVKINRYKNEFLLNAYLQKEIDQAFLSLPEDVRLRLEIPAFFDGIEIYHGPQTLTHLFPKDNIPFTQNPQLSASLILSKKLKELGGTLTSPLFSGIYDLAYLIQYFRSLRKEIEGMKPVFPLTIVLVSINHIVIVSYDRDAREWLLFESNNEITTNNNNNSESINTITSSIKKYRHSKDLAKEVLESFSVNNIVALTTHLCTTKEFNIQLSELYKTWVDHPVMKELHTVTSEKAHLYDSDFGTWLRSAVESNEPNQVKLLLKTGISPNGRKEVQQSTPLYLAIDINKIDIVKTLLKHGADPNLKYNSYFPLHKAAWSGAFEILELLLSNKAEINAVDKFNFTALYYAASHGHINIVKRLLELGANPHIASIKGKTPQQIAVKYGHVNIAETIEEHIEQTIPVHTVCKKILDLINEFINKEKINDNELQAWKDVKQVIVLPTNQDKSFFKIINELKYDKKRKTNIDSIYPSYECCIFSSEDKNSKMLKKLIRRYKDKNLNEIDQKRTLKNKMITMGLNLAQI